MKTFLSSTYIDLVDHRERAVEAFERLGQQVGRMEVFGARPEEPSSECYAEIDKCDIFVGVYAHRYGYVPAGSNVSITEAEFDYAKKHNKPAFCFFVDDNYPWPPKMVDDSEVMGSQVMGSGLTFDIQSLVFYPALKFESAG